MWILAKEFRFEAAHQLPNHDGKCARLHGHSWRGIIYVAGDALVENGPKEGMVIDYSDIKNYIKPLLEDYLDHYFLNETTGLAAPTSENLAQWIYEKLEAAGMPGLIAVRIDETCTSLCVYSKSKLADFVMGDREARDFSSHRAEPMPVFLTALA
ncbi:MAG: 6-carboxytetrahydropterin synthase QueD [Chloroflexaceae bacterium]|nr:6-carboxytetrahydropterin synthase QueD [Chloroflexaceae bacterium]